MIKKGFILEPYYELLPDFKICPFSNKDLHVNRYLPLSRFIDDYFKNRFDNKEFLYTLNGREAISIALKHYKLNEKDIVTILTTTNNYYVSSCITKEIEKVCRWSRTIEPETRVIFVNHEFGFPYPELHKLKELNIPIIEDCAHSFFSNNEENAIGKIGDFVIYSFPKMFPIQIGGLLVINNQKLNSEYLLNEEINTYIRNILSYYIEKENIIKNNRVLNYSVLREKFKELECEERFVLEKKTVPGVFMFKIVDRNIDLAGLKKYYYAHGVQCSQFYNENAFFLPCHQNLCEDDLDYFVEIYKAFIYKKL